MTTLDVSEINAIVFDFDGVLTDNHVYLNQEGEESVRCNRSDGLAFDALNTTNIKLFILSTEKNLVVEQRAKKLNVTCYQGLNDKLQTLISLSNDYEFKLEKTLYVGNDLNDYKAMEACGWSACPADSHKKIQEISKIKLEKKGGDGVVRELVENFFMPNLLKNYYVK